MDLHPDFREVVETLASNEDLDGYHTFCRMVRICATLDAYMHSLSPDVDNRTNVRCKSKRYQSPRLPHHGVHTPRPHHAFHNHPSTPQR